LAETKKRAASQDHRSSPGGSRRGDIRPAASNILSASFEKLHSDQERNAAFPSPSFLSSFSFSVLFPPLLFSHSSPPLAFFLGLFSLVVVDGRSGAHKSRDFG